MKAIDLNAPIARVCRNAPERLRVLEDLGLVAKLDPSQSLSEACKAQGLEPHTVAWMLTAFEKMSRRVPAVAVELMTLMELCDYLDNVQHVYLWRELTELERLIRSAAEREGADHSRLLKLQKAFAAFREKLTSHLREETEVLFPLIRQLAGGAGRRIRLGHSIKIPTIRMEIQHSEVDEGLAELRALAGDGSVSVSPLTRKLGRTIARFEQRFQELIYEENRILFPRALAVSRV